MDQASVLSQVTALIVSLVTGRGVHNIYGGESISKNHTTHQIEFSISPVFERLDANLLEDQMQHCWEELLRNSFIREKLLREKELESDYFTVGLRKFG